MSSSDAKARFAASRGALKAIYYVLIGLAIRESLVRVFLTNNSFRSVQLFNQQNLPSLLLLLAFLPTISRLVHGASIHLDDVHTYRFKPLFDFFGFLVQASIFYVMALSIENVVSFNLVFSILLFVDTVWLVVLLGMSYIDFGPTEKQWIISNVLMLLVLAVVWAIPLGLLASAGVILGASWVATVADYAMNQNFYFPKQDTTVQTSTAG